MPPVSHLSRAIDAACTDDGTNQKDMAGALDWPTSKLTEIKLGAQQPRLNDLFRLSDHVNVPLEGLLDDETRLDLRDNQEIRWRLAGRSAEVGDREQRLAADGVLRGWSPKEITERIRTLYLGRQLAPPVLDEERIHTKAQAAVRSGRVEIVLSKGAEELADRELGRELAAALGSVACGRPVRVYVVRNLCHPSFRLDPLAPLLVALLAHRLVKSCLHRKASFRIGLAGGIHCESFVRMTGMGSSPFPESAQRREVRFVPLTLEPFSDHRLPLAGDVVGDMAVRARDLLEPGAVEAFTIQPFGYLVRGQFVPDHSHAIVLTRTQYPKLHVAIFGCGDRKHDGWLSEILESVHLGAAGERAETDVCLNLLSKAGEPIPLPDGREFVGVGLRHIERLVEREDRMALLLTSGPDKGLPLSIVARAGYADTLVCDQAAARAALEVLA